MAKTKIEILGPPTGYTDLLDAALLEKMKKEKADKKRWHPLRPSSAGYCSRRLAYALMEYRGYATYNVPLEKPETARLLNLGHSVEYQSIRDFQLLKDFQVKYRQQTVDLFPMKRGLPDLPEERLEGSMDLVLWSPKHKCVIDVKSKKDRFSQGFRTGWDQELDKLSRLDSVSPISDTALWVDDLPEFIEELGPADWLIDNLVQLNLYATSQFLKARGVDHFVVYRYNKNDSKHMEIRCRPSEEVAKKVEDKFNLVNTLVDQKRVEDVPRDFFFGSMRCAFCPYSAECWGKDAQKAFFDFVDRDKTEPVQVKKDEPLAELFEQYLDDLEAADEAADLEEQILKAMVDNKVQKVKLPTGEVFEAKYLKSPKPHFEVRRSKE